MVWAVSENQNVVRQVFRQHAPKAAGGTADIRLAFANTVRDDIVIMTNMSPTRCATVLLL